MLRIALWVALVSILYTIRSTDAANCTATSFKQNLTATQFAAANIIAADYATSTKEQIIAKLLETFKESVINIDYTVNQTGDSVSIAYKIIFACNETTTTVLPDGSKKTTEVKSKCDKKAVEEAVTHGLTDRANQLSVRAQQAKAGASDTTCDFNMGGTNFFEWSIQTSAATYKSAMTSGSFKTDADFYTALTTYFRARLNSAYASQIANVTFVSRTTSGTNRYALTFRVYFLKTVSDATMRTSIVSSIQSVYYEVIVKYFVSISKSMKIPSSTKISTPTAVSTVSKKAILTRNKDSTQSVLTGSRLKLTKISSSKSSGK